MHYYYINACDLQGAAVQDWIDLRTWNGVVYDTYIDTAIAAGLLQTDFEWIDAIKQGKSNNINTNYLLSLIINVYDNNESIRYCSA